MKRDFLSLKNLLDNSYFTALVSLCQRFIGVFNIMRNSRINPNGSRFIAIQQWAIKMLGFNAAAVLSVLDFRDQYEENPGVATTTISQLEQHLEGVIARRSIDSGLKELIARNWITQAKYTRVNSVTGNLNTTPIYGLNIEEIIKTTRSMNEVPYPSPTLQKSKVQALQKSKTHGDLQKSKVLNKEDKKERNKKTTTKKESSDSDAGLASSSSAFSISLDEKLFASEKELEVVTHLVISNAVDEQTAQNIADELCGRMRAGKNSLEKPIASTVSYCRGILKKVSDGEFTLAYGIQEQARRIKIAKLEASKSGAISVLPPSTALLNEETESQKLIASYHAIAALNPKKAKIKLDRLTELAALGDEESALFLKGFV